jgi:hypothetical protein
MKKLNYIIITLVAMLFLCAFAVTAQSLSGVPGLVQTPTANFMKDGTFYVGGNYLPKERLSYSNYRYNGGVLFISLTFLPNVEVDMRFTKQLGRPSYMRHTMDRAPGVRVRLLRETQQRPAIVFGIHDVFSTVANGRARHFGATYVVCTKRFYYGSFLVAPSLGFGFDFFEAQGKELMGVFGGARIRSKYFKPLAVLVDYDTQFLNFGLDFYAAHGFRLKVGFLSFRYFVAGISMHFNLFDVF